MKQKIEIKRISKDLISEGISIELLNKVQLLDKISPVMFQIGDEPVNLIKCNKDYYWVLLPDGSYLKDDKVLIKYDLKTCLIARARYLLNHYKKEINKETKFEVERLKSELTKIAEKVINKFKEIQRYAGKIEEAGIQRMLFNTLKLYFPQEYEQRQKAAIQILDENPELEEYINTLNEELLKQDFDNLYIRLKTDGLPVLLTVNHNDEVDMDLAKALFHKDNIEKTIGEIKNKNHIEIIAKFNVERRYIGIKKFIGQAKSISRIN